MRSTIRLHLSGHSHFLVSLVSCNQTLNTDSHELLSSVSNRIWTVRQTNIHVLLC